MLSTNPLGETGEVSPVYKDVMPLGLTFATVLEARCVKITSRVDGAYPIFVSVVASCIMEPLTTT